MTLGCESAAFERTDALPGEPQWQAGGYVVVTFQDAIRNTDQDRLVELAYQILRHVSGAGDFHIGFEMEVQPLKLFFGRTDCYVLQMKPLGYGSDKRRLYMHLKLRPTTLRVHWSI